MKPSSPSRRIGATELLEHGRLRDEGTTLWQHFGDDILVVCPRCSRRASVRDGRLSCGACGLTRQRTDTVAGLTVAKRAAKAEARCPRCEVWNRWRGFVEAGHTTRELRCGCGCVYPATARTERRRDFAVDPHFGEQLWLTTATRHGVLWARNEAHLDWLEAVVAATLRERTGPAQNTALLSRLPRWLKSAKNRTANRAALARLRQRLAEA